MASETKMSTVRGLMRCRSWGSTSAGAAGLGGVLAQVVAERLARHQRLARRRAERERLDARGGARHGRLADDGDGRVDRPGHADLEGGRREQLRHVGVEHLVGGGDLGEAEVDHPGPAVRRQHHVGQAQVAVGDAVRAHRLDALPDAAQDVVGDRLVVHPVQGIAGRALVGEQEPLVADVRR